MDAGRISFLAVALGICLAAATLANAADPSPGQTLTQSGSLPTFPGPKDYFTGTVHVQQLFTGDPALAATGGRVTFEPGARSAWHSHPAGQYLIILDGVGWVQQWGGPVLEVHAGDVVWCPPGVKHWHGASSTKSMTQISITGVRGDTNVQWLEKVSDEQYQKNPPR
ncbi:MAG: cupin domain-containing protein [Burkholderiaceae bacterium]